MAEKTRSYPLEGEKPTTEATSWECEDNGPTTSKASIKIFFTRLMV